MKSIYIIKNKLNNKIYVGSSTNPNQRFRDHICNAFTKNKSGKLYDAIREMGKDNFFIEIIEKVEKRNAEERETYYIKKFNSVENGYNTKYRIEGITTLKEYDEKKIIELYSKGYTLKQIGNIYHTDKMQISKILKQNNIPIRNWNLEQSNPLISKDFLMNELKTKSVKEIANELNLSTTAIRNWMKKFNLNAAL